MIPAKVAGVKRIAACSPPGRNGGINPGILYTIIACTKWEWMKFTVLEGTQAIGAFAFGTQTKHPVDLIVGPGNQYVMEAKRQAFVIIGIDSLAGPSECLVIADKTGRDDFIAANLLAQCEHDPNARGALVTTSEALAYETLKEIERQLRERTIEEVARISWGNKGW